MSSAAFSAMNNLKNTKRRFKAQFATLMGADETKDERVTVQLERFKARSEELKQMQKELRKMGDHLLKFFTASEDCLSISGYAPELYQALSMKGSHASIANMLDERVFGVLDATLTHIRQLEEVARERRDLVLDFDHHRRQYSKCMEKAQATQGDPDKHADAVRVAEERNGKMDIARGNLESSTENLLRKLDVFERAYMEVVANVVDALTAVHQYYCTAPGYGRPGEEAGTRSMSSSVYQPPPAGAGPPASFLSLNPTEREHQRSSILTKLETSPAGSIRDSRGASAGGAMVLVKALENAEAAVTKEEKNKLFGKDLREIDQALPHVIEMLAFLERDPASLGMEGIFRTSGDASIVQQLRETMDHGPCDLDQVAVTLHAGVPEIAALLKLYFRELPHPLLPVTFYSSFQGPTLKDDELFVETARKAVQALSPVASKALRLLLACLCRVKARSDTNLMDAKNLAVCFAPTLVEMPPSDGLDEMSQVRGGIDLMTKLLELCDRIFQHEELHEGYPTDVPPKPHPPPSASTPAATAVAADERSSGAVAVNLPPPARPPPISPGFNPPPPAGPPPPGPPPRRPPPPKLPPTALPVNRGEKAPPTRPPRPLPAEPLSAGSPTRPPRPLPAEPTSAGSPTSAASNGPVTAPQTTSLASGADADPQGDTVPASQSEEAAAPLVDVQLEEGNTDL